ncbi:hypothetical protein PF010_g12737 [Phytophthora fragariae]|nr:hypothetical protein PF010_g12737 [Phytophthora fragariae]
MMNWIQARDTRSKLPSTISGDSVQMEAESPWIILTKPKFRKQLVVALA